MLQSIKSAATGYVKKAAVDYAVNKAKNTLIGTSSDAERSIKKHEKEAQQDTNDILSKYWPLIEKKVLELVGKGLSDDASLDTAFRTAHSFMPLPVRILLTEDRFVAYCMSQKFLFLGGIGQGESNTIKPVPRANDQPSVDARNKTSLDGLSKNNYRIYENLVPELIAFCVISNGVVQDSEIKMAVSIIRNDEIIRDKKRAIESLSSYIKINMSNKRNAQDLYDLNLSALTSKIAKLESSLEKHRVDMIIESMLRSVEEISVENSMQTANIMRASLA